MNYSGLQTLYFEDATAQCIFDHFAAQKRNQRVSVVSRLVLMLRKEGRKVSPSKVGSVLKKMSAIGCGKFIKGDSVGESRFEWNMQSRVAGIVASGESPITAEEIEEELGPFDRGIDVGVINAVVTHTFQIRRGLFVTFDIPSDLTDVEAKRLACFIQSLPIGEGG